MLLSPSIKNALRLGLTWFENVLLELPIGMLLPSQLFIPVGYMHKAGELELASILMLKYVNKFQKMNIYACLHFQA